MRSDRQCKISNTKPHVDTGFDILNTSDKAVGNISASIMMTEQLL